MFIKKRYKTTIKQVKNHDKTAINSLYRQGAGERVYRSWSNPVYKANQRGLFFMLKMWYNKYK